MGRAIVVRATWDPEANVWVVESDDLPLVTEAASIDILMEKLPGLLQDLLEDEEGDGDEVEIPFELIARINERVRIRSRTS
jgi:predicted RNase H-like HicB family nuclease